jgi:hypothetical protein
MSVDSPLSDTANLPSIDPWKKDLDKRSSSIRFSSAYASAGFLADLLESAIEVFPANKL